MASITHIDVRVSYPRTGSKWGWFVALGTVLIALAVLAFFNVPAATAVSVYSIAILMLVAAVAQVGAAFSVISWSGFVLLLLSSVLYGAAAILAMVNPTLAAAALTLMLAFALIFAGVMRLWWSIVLRHLPGSAWTTASGIVTTLGGIAFVADWPGDTVWLLGVVLAFDLTFQGATAIALGLALRRAGR